MENRKLKVSATPHIRAKGTVSDIMLDVIIALAFPAIVGTFYFGFRAALIVLVSVAACVGFEFLFNIVGKRRQSVGDLSAVVTGMLLAFGLPVSVPLWVPVVGAGFAIIVVKMIFGGMGQNFINPALGGRAFLLAAYPVLLTNWDPGANGRVVDAFSGATPLAALRLGEGFVNADLTNAFLGRTLGSIGETAAVAILLGGLFLLWRRVISWRIPATYIATFALLAWVFGRGDGMFTGHVLYELFLGSVLLGAVFMATDYSTSPVTPRGQLIFGAGCGALNAIFRFYSGLPEGTTYAIMLMNLCTPLIDRFTRPKVYGHRKERSA